MMAELEKQAAAPRPRPGSACARLVRRLRQPAFLYLPVVRPKQALAGGRAPTCLLRALSGPARAPRRLALLCDWAEKAPNRPRLVAGPLMGACLADLVRFDQGAKRETEAAAPQRAALPLTPDSLRPSSLITTEKATSANRLEHPQSWAAQAASLLRHIDKPSVCAAPQASLELLARHAGGARAVAALSRRARISGLSSRAIPPTRPAARGAGVQPAYSPSELVNHLGRRLVQHLGQVSPPVVGVPASSFMHETWGERSMALPPAGPQAPHNLLLRLAGMPAAGTGASAGPASSPLLRSPAERSPSGMLPWEAPFSRAPRQAAPAPTTLIPPGAQQGFYPQAGSIALPGAGQPNYRPPFAPPLAASTPPTLMTPQDVYDAPTPYAAAAMRQKANEDDDLLAQENLDDLAGKIKRILDEEARRFGIPT